MKSKANKKKTTMPVGSGDLLGGKFDKLIKCLQNNISWLLLVPILCLQTTKSAGQNFKPLGVTENISCALNLGVERRELGLICQLCRGIATSAPNRQSRELNLGMPLLQKSEKGTLTGGTVSNGSKPVSNQSSDENSDKSDNRICGWASHVIWFLFCVCVGFLLVYSGQRLPPNDRS